MPGPALGSREGVAHDPLDAERRVDAHLGGDLGRRACAHRAAVADVRALGALAHDDEVDVARVGQRGRDAREEPRRPQVDVVVELEAQPEQQPALEQTAGRLVSPGSADRPEQDRVVPAQLVQDVVGKHLAGGVPALGPEVVRRSVDWSVPRPRPRRRAP